MSFLRRQLRWILTGALAFAGLTKIVEWITEAWFFDSVGQVAVYLRMMAARGALFACGVAWSAVILAVNLRHAQQVAAQHNDAPSQRLIPLRDKRLLDQHRRFWGGITLLVALLLCGSYCSAHWLVLLRLLAAEPTGIRDPIFNLDVAFYLFTLPALNFGWTFVNATLWLALAATALLYVYEEVLETAGRRWQITSEGLRHLSALGIALLLWKAAGYRLGAWNLLTARGAAFGGFDWTALHIRVPFNALLSILALTAAWFLHRSTRRGDAPLTWRVPLAFCAANFALGTLLPWTLQILYAAPRRAMLEGPTLQMRRAATAQAFGLDAVQNAPQKPATDAQIRAAAAGFPAWRESELLRYLNAHERRGDFVFSSLHFDSYEIDGVRRAVFVAARERLPVTNADWRSVQGFSVVVCDATRRTPEGAPLFYQLPLTHPEIIFGELPENPNAWLLTGPNTPLPDVMTRRASRIEAADTLLLPADYRGAGGTALHSPGRRLMLAWRFFARSTFEAANGTRLVWHRRVVERCAALAPFLLFEEPRLVISKNGRLIWMVNAHSVADSYPLAEALTGTRLNALRYAAVATVDAFDGSVRFFAAEGSDPMLAAYRRVFPTLFHDWSELPDDLRSHLPYPALLFSAQSDLWARLITPSPEELLRGERWQTATLIQPARWGPQQALPLATQSTLSRNGLLTSQIFTHARPEDESVLNGPIAGMLLGKLGPDAKSYSPQLWQWLPPKPIALPLKADSGNEPQESFAVPRSLLAVPIGDELLLRYTETREGKFGGDHAERETWLIAAPNPRSKPAEEPFAQGDTLDATLAAWWLRRAGK